MDSDKILKLADFFYALAKGEELPANSKDLKTVLKNIEQLETHGARKKYAEKNLKRLSSGSARLVYLTPDKTIVKLAKNDKGLAQNEAESNPKMTSKFLNKTISSAKNNSWMQTHYLDKISAKDFEEMTGIDFDDFGESIRYGLKNVSGHSDKTKPKNFDKVSKSEIYKEMKRIGDKFRLMGGDLARISSWGTKDGRPILIDAGLTKDVFSEFYEST
jgi:hypothetical protein